MKEVMTIDYFSSASMADSLMHENEYLERVEAATIYNQRLAGFQDLGITNEVGYTGFIPNVTQDFTEHWDNLIRGDWQNLHRTVREHNVSDYWEREQALENLHTWVRTIDKESILSRTVPENLRVWIDGRIENNPDWTFFKKIPKSPKLTKLIAFLYGSASGGALDWLTTKAPREIVRGELDEYRIYVSVLPHHVAGMSFYSSYNHGGERWGGQNGTSCQDPRNEDSFSLIGHLPGSVAEQTLGVAWLTKRENNDAWRPVMEARALVRIVPTPTKNLFIICKQYGTNETVKNILLEGLKNQYPNRMLSRAELADYSVERIDIEVDIWDCNVEVEYGNPECPHCDSDGEVLHNCDCEHCPHNGEYMPCPECGGDNVDPDGGYETQCFTPYVDDTDFVAIDDTLVTYTIPVTALQACGVPVENGELVEA